MTGSVQGRLCRTIGTVRTLIKIEGFAYRSLVKGLAAAATMHYVKQLVEKHEATQVTLCTVGAIMV